MLKNTTKTSNDLEEIKMIHPKTSIFITQMGGYKVYDYYLVGSIDDPENYIEVCHALRTAEEDDIFIIRINSHGGQLRSGQQIINAIQDSPANVVGYIEHDCGSMATFIFLACDSWGVSPHAEWFSHTISSGISGKESETYEHARFLRRQTQKRVKEGYQGFLSEDEIENVLKGQDIYLDAEEIEERLQSYAERFGDDGDVEPNKTLDEMVKDAVKSGIEELMKDLNVVAPKKAAPKKRATKTTTEQIVKENEQ